MKKLGRHMLSLVAAIHLAVLPAMITTAPQMAHAGKLDSAKAAGIQSFKWIESQGRNGVEAVVNGVKVVLQKATPRQMMEFSPKSIRKLMSKFQKSSKASFKKKDKVLSEGTIADSYEISKRASLNLFEHFRSAGKSFPADVWMFFVILGAFNASKLIFNFSHNPMAVKNFFDQQTDPVGLFSFFTFMFAQRTATAILDRVLSSSAIAGKPGVHAIQNSGFTGLLGMSVGSLTQTLTSQVMYDPEFKKCRDSFFIRETSPGPKCDKLFESLSNFSWTDQIPGMASMLFSAVAATVVLQFIGAGAVAAGSLVRIGGINFASKVEAFTVSYISGNQAKWANAIAFIGLNELLDPAFQWVWKNNVQSRDLTESEKNIVELISQNKNKNWNIEEVKNECSAANKYEDCDLTLGSSLNKFTWQMRRWHEMNLESIMTAYAEWQKKLNGFFSTYLGTQQVYQNIWTEVNNSSTRNKNTILPSDRIYPFFGVKVVDPAKPNENLDNLQLSSPKDAEILQRKWIESEALKISEMLNQSKDQLRESEQKNLQSLIEGFSPQNNEYLSKKLLDVQYLSDGQVPGDLVKAFTLNKFNEWLPSDWKILNLAHSSRYNEIMFKIKEDLGEPKPKLNRGEGWVSANQKFAKEGMGFEETDGMAKKENDFYTPTISEYSLVGMVCGPELQKGESIAKLEAWKWGYPVQFYPPKILKLENRPMAVFTDGQKFDLCKSPSLRKYTKDIYRTKIKLENDPSAQYRGILDYIKQNIRPEFKDTFLPDEWWVENVNPEIYRWQHFFEQKYGQIVRELAEAFRGEKSGHYFTIENQKQSVFNVGYVSNDLFTSLKQEVKLYLMILGEVYKDAAKAKKITNEKSALFQSANSKYASIHSISDSKSNFHLLKYFETQERKNRPTNFDFDSIFSKWDPKLLLNARTNPFQFQTEIESSLNNLMSRLKMLSVVEKSDSSLTNRNFEISNPFALNELSETLQDMEKKIDQLNAELGLSQAAGPEIAKANQSGPSNAQAGTNAALTPEQAKAAAASIAGLKAVFNELIEYGNMVEAFDYERFNEKTNGDPGSEGERTIKTQPKSDAPKSIKRMGLGN